MKQQTTFSFLRNKIAVAVITLASCSSYAQLIYSNGPISTGTNHVATSTAAPAGYTWSELETPSTSFGFGAMYNNAATTDLALSDDFVVPTGETWNVTNLDFYGYQTGYTGTVPPIDALRVRIWNGDPSLPTSTVVAGDMTTNVYNAAGSGEEMIYRVSNTVGTTRKVWKFNANLTATLAAGTYWVEYQVHATNDLNIFVPPVTILGTPTDAAWNSKQRTAAVWAALQDAGTASGKAIAFKVNGTVSLGLNSNENNSNFTMYPMPAKSVCNFTLNNEINAVAKTVSLYDLKGALVLEQNVENKANISVNVAKLNAGIYVVKIVDAQGQSIFTDKLIKE